jgi:FkbM family methyltransferase
MNAFATASRYLRRPLEILRNRHKIRLWRRISYALIQRLSLCEHFKVRYYGAYFHPFPSSISLALWLYGEQFRAQDLQFLLELLRPGDTFIDVGANIGTHTICIGANLGASTKVYSFEPHPRIYSYLKKNVALNKLHNIHHFNVALGETEGMVTLSDDMLDDRNYIVSASDGFSIPLRSLDSFGCMLTGFPIVKLDVEGYELPVLKGASRTLKGIRFLYLEVGDRHSKRFGYSAWELMEFLRQMGWHLFRFEQPKTLAEIFPEYQPPDVENIVCVRSLEDLAGRLKTYRIQMR